MLDVAALLVTLTAVFSYINHRYVRLPTTIGVMAIALVLSVVLIVASALGFGSTEQQLETLLRRLDFNFVLMKGMLSFLLFAGALHIDLEELKKRKWPIAILATFGVVFSTFAIGAATRFVLGALGMELDWIYCLLFGALISPTDPIAVLGILKSAGAPKGLEIKIAGESLFNDGVAVVVFLVLARIAAGVDPTVASVAGLFFEEVVGGILFGLTIGYIAFRMLRSIDNYQVEVMITLALVLGGYALASAIHVSGPLAMVVAGLLIGNTGRSFAMSATTQEHLDMFWELVDEILNGILFYADWIRAGRALAAGTLSARRRAARTGGAVGSVHLGRGPIRDHAPVHEAEPARDQGADLGWDSGRDLGRAGSGIAREPRASARPHDDIRHRALLDHGAGSHPRPAGALRDPGGLKGRFRIGGRTGAAWKSDVPSGPTR